VAVLLCVAAVSSTFTCTLKFVVKDCDPNTGEPDDEGYEDEYVVSRLFCYCVLYISICKGIGNSAVSSTAANRIVARLYT